MSGSGGIRTHASGETGALIQRLRPLGHATSWMCNTAPTASNCSLAIFQSSLSTSRIIKLITSNTIRSCPDDKDIDFSYLFISNSFLLHFKIYYNYFLSFHRSLAREFQSFFYGGFLEIWPFQKDLNAWANLKIKLIIKSRTSFQSDLCKKIIKKTPTVFLKR